VLYQGVLNKGRGLETAIKAIVGLDLKVQLHIAGEGDLSEELRSLAQQIDNDNKVVFLGWKLPHELKELTQQAWLGINLLDGTSKNYQYSLANKFFDYMHAEVPSINMAFPTYKRYIDADKVGLVLDRLDVSKLQVLISDLYNDDALYSSMITSIRNAKQKYNWKLESKALLSQIKTVIDG